MIVGSVNARLEAILRLQIEDSSGHLHIFDTIIDTGFNGDVTLTTAEILALGLPRLGEVISQLADGGLQRIDVYDAILWWDSYATQVRVQAVETDSILGTGVLAGYELKLPFVAGATVTIDRIP
jgi:predicted aspartyl protease